MMGVCLLALISLFLVESTAGQRLPAGTKVDHVVVYKRERTLSLYRQGTLLKSYKVALGGDPVGAKVQQGDHKTPEGAYVLNRKNPRSKFYRSIHISYPDAVDRARAKQLSVPPGGDIFLHRLPNGYGLIGASHRLRDWTTAASPSPIKRWTKFERLWQKALRLRSCHECSQSGDGPTTVFNRGVADGLFPISQKFAAKMQQIAFTPQN